MRTSTLYAVVAACLAVVPAGVTHQAADDPGGTPARVTDLPVARVNPDVDPDIIALLPEVVQQSTVVIDEGFIPGSPIVYPDGAPVEGQGPDIEARAAAAAAECGGTATATGLGTWGTESVCGVAVFGSPGYVRSYS